MAASSSFCNFLTFLLPMKPPLKTPPPPPPPQLNLPPSSTHLPSQTQKSPHRLVPLVPQDDHFSSASSSSSATFKNTSLSVDLCSVICPALAYTNTLFFKSTYNVQVVVDDYEPEERLLNRFRREVMKAGIIQECKRRRFFETKQDEKKRKSRQAAKRNRRRRPQSRSSAQNKQDVTTTKKKRDEDEDNWDLPDGDALY